MTPEQRVIMLLALLAEQSGENVSQQRIEFLAQRLFPLGAMQVAATLERLLDSARRFPTVAEIKQEMGLAEPTSRDEALLLVDTIYNGICRYGSLQPGNSKGAVAIEAALGPVAWEIVKRQGGWNAVVDRAGDNLAVFRAQIRDVVETYLKTGAIERGQIPQSLPSHHEALLSVSRDPLLLEKAEAEDRKVLESKLDELKKLRQLSLMQVEHDKARAKRGEEHPDPKSDCHKVSHD